MSKVLKTVNGEMLLNTFLPPIEFAVENLIPQGLHILSGSPKIGKSWLVLMLCLKVASIARGFTARAFAPKTARTFGQQPVPTFQSKGGTK